MTISVTKKFVIDFTEYNSSEAKYVTKKVFLTELEVEELIKKLKTVKRENEAKK